MPDDNRAIADRIAHLAAFLASSDAVRVRIESHDEEIEIARYAHKAGPQLAAAAADAVTPEVSPLRVEAIKADLVGIFRLSRPLPFEGETLEDDRELAFVEALGIRNPVRSLGPGRIVSIAAEDGAAVEYGQPLFLMHRG